MKKEYEIIYSITDEEPIQEVLDIFNSFIKNKKKGIKLTARQPFDEVFKKIKVFEIVGENTTYELFRLGRGEGRTISSDTDYWLYGRETPKGELIPLFSLTEIKQIWLNFKANTIEIHPSDSSTRKTYDVAVA